MHKDTLWICGHRKCGTTLLTNLFDSHQDIINYGSDFRMIYAFNDHLTKLPCPLKRRERFEKLFFDDRIEGDEVNRTAFREIISKLDFASNEVVWEYLKELREALDSERYLMIKETSSEMYFCSIRNVIDAKFLHLVRDPRDNWAAIAAGVDSYYQRFGEGRLEALASTIFRIQTGYEALKANLEAADEKEYRVLKFEDLIQTTGETMASLSQWLNIEVTADLESPTRAGDKYKGNSHDGMRFDGVSKTNLARFEKRLPRVEIAIIEAFCAPMMEYFHYPFTTGISERLSARQEFYSFFNSRYFYYDKHEEL